jgi:hypothetical protein
MSRNRMKNSQSLHWMGVVKWVLILGLVSVLGLSYMFCKNQNLHLADEKHLLRLKLDAIERRNHALGDDLEWMKSPAVLQRRLVEMHSTLIHLYDSRMVAHVRHMEGQSTRMSLARIGTMPQGINTEANPVGSLDTVSPSDSQR